MAKLIACFTDGKEIFKDGELYQVVINGKAVASVKTLALAINYIDDSIASDIERLDTLFGILNLEFYGSELPKPIIHYYRDESRSCYGWITVAKNWISSTNETYEINICANTCFDEHVFSTLLHEMVHLYNLVHGIRDVSNNGYYHNKAFKDVAESHGLNCEHHARYGWTMTTLNTQAREFCSKLNFKLSHTYGIKPPTPTAEKPNDDGSKPNDGSKPKTRKPNQRRYTYVCPDCGKSAISYASDLKITCSCGQEMHC